VPADIFDNILQRLESERASQSQRPATELGLAFCKMVATAHGGTIRVSPNYPAGAIFTVNLPFGL
ncbi:MAG: ATP-binding protein, partial [Caldilineaceae bacterium]|nr:ATP-binding protein [Caldilineaceae bacterium]